MSQAVYQSRERQPANLQGLSEERARGEIMKKGIQTVERSRKGVIRNVQQTSRFITTQEAEGQVKPRNLPLLRSGKLLTVAEGVTIQRVQCGNTKRYRLTQDI